MGFAVWRLIWGDGIVDAGFAAWDLGGDEPRGNGYKEAVVFHSTLVF
jgi:hypothetical protein